MELLLGEDYIKYININENNEEGYSLLQLACKKFKDDKYKKIIKTIINHQHICINYRCGEYDTALMIACVENNLTATKALLKHPNINVNRTDEKSPTPLHIACKCGNEEIVKLLLKNNKIKINEITQEFCYPALSIAIINSKPKIVKLLLKEKAIDIYEYLEDPEEDVPLAILIRNIKDNKEVNDNTELIIKAFIKYKWEEIDNEDKEELLKKCMEHQKTHLVSLILDKHDKKQKEINDILLNSDSSKDEQDEMQDHSDEIESDFYVSVEDLFLSACSNNDKHTSQMLIGRYDINSNLYNKGLIMVSKSKSVGTTELARLLISNNADVNYIEEHYKRSRPLHHACDSGNLELVKLLIDNEAEVNCRTYVSCTPLHNAVSNKNLQITKILVDNKADINSRDENGLTPLHNAVGFGYLEIAKILIYNNPDINSLLVTKVLGEYILDDVLKIYCNRRDKDDLENLIEYLLNKGALYSEIYDKNKYTKDLLEEIKTKILTQDTKSMW